MKLKLGYQALIAQAMAQIETLSLEQAQKLVDDEDTVFIDIRDVRELEREGMIPNALHAPRGMLCLAATRLPGRSTCHDGLLNSFDLRARCAGLGSLAR